MAVVLGAALADLEGRTRAALACGVAAALLRPEAWPLLAAQGLWLLHRDRSRETWLLLGAAAVLVLGLWFVPEKLGSGDFLRGAARGREPVAGSPAQSSFPFGAVFTNGARALIYPVYAGAVVAALDAVRRRRVAVLVLGGAATVWMLAVAALAQTGFTGNLRYVLLPASILCVLAGVGWVRAAQLLPARPRAAVLAVAAVASVPGVVAAVDTLADDYTRVRTDEQLLDELPHVIARAGGEDEVTRCGMVVTGPLQTQALAWELHLREQQVGLRPGVPGTILARSVLPLAHDARYPVVLTGRHWVLRRVC